MAVVCEPTIDRDRPNLYRALSSGSAAALIDRGISSIFTPCNNDPLTIGRLPRLTSSAAAVQHEGGLTMKRSICVGMILAAATMAAATMAASVQAQQQTPAAQRAPLTTGSIPQRAAGGCTNPDAL